MGILSVDPGLTSTGVWYHEHGWSQSLTLVRTKGEDRYLYLARVREELVRQFGGEHHPDIGLVEDYPYHMPGTIMAAAAEAGGVVRSAMAEIGVRFIAIPIGTWKSIVGFTGMKKDTIAQRAAYLKVAADQPGAPDFDSADAADAFLMWVAFQKILCRDVETKTAEKIRDQAVAIGEMQLIGEGRADSR